MKLTRELLEENGIGWHTELTEQMLYKLIKNDAKYVNHRARNQIEKMENEIYKQKIITQLFRFAGTLYVQDVGKISKKMDIELEIEPGIDTELASLFTLEIHHNPSSDIYSTKLKTPTDQQLDNYVDQEGKLEKVGSHFVEGFVLKRVFAEDDTMFEMGYNIQKKIETIYRILSDVDLTRLVLEQIYPKVLEDYTEYRKKEMEKLLEERFYAV